MSSEADAVLAWKSRLSCGVCGKSLADEEALMVVGLPWLAPWACPTVMIAREGVHAVSGIVPVVVEGVCSDCFAPGSTNNPNPVRGSALRHVVVFLCAPDAGRARADYGWLVRHAAKAPKFSPAPDRPKYHPLRASVCYVSVVGLEFTDASGGVIRGDAPEAGEAGACSAPRRTRTGSARR